MEQEAWPALRAFVPYRRLGKTAIDEMKGPHVSDGHVGGAYTLEATLIAPPSELE